MSHPHNRYWNWIAIATTVVTANWLLLTDYALYKGWLTFENFDLTSRWIIGILLTYVALFLPKSDQ